MSNISQVKALNQKLLKAVSTGDWETYKSLCAEDLSCFEPETAGQVVEGLNFHQYYFDLGAATAKAGAPPPLQPNNVSMTGVHAREIGSTVILSYVRIDQALSDGSPVTRKNSETRIWEKRDDGWKNVHFHKSPVS